MGPFSLAAAALSLLGPPPSSCGDSYTVARHETLYSIARRCGLAVGAIARANRIAPTRIAAGQRLILPQGNENGGRARRHEGRALIYRFQHGDTLYSLARWARVDLRALLAANPCIDPRDIDAGAAIRLPAGAVAPESARLRERGAPHAAAMAPPRVRMAPPPPIRPAPPRPPRAAPLPPPPPRDDSADQDEGKPAGDANTEEEEPEGL